MSQEPANLAVVDETSIQELIDTDPRELTDKDLRTIVVYQRANREVWLKNEEEAKASGGRTKKPKLTLEDMGDLTLDLGDL